MQVLEANERKVGKLRFIPINNGHGEELDNKGMTRVVSRKVVKQITEAVDEQDSDKVIEVRLEAEDERSHETVLLQGELQLEDSYSNNTSQKLGNHDQHTQ